MNNDISQDIKQINNSQEGGENEIGKTPLEDNKLFKRNKIKYLLF